MRRASIHYLRLLFDFFLQMRTGRVLIEFPNIQFSMAFNLQSENLVLTTMTQLLHYWRNVEE